MKKQRDILPDIVRGFAILMVVFGHCIQEGNGYDFSINMLYFDDKLYQLIYSFHMPLFAMLAGYYAYPGISRCESKSDRWKILGKRASTFLIPIFIWTLFEYTRECILNVKLGFRTYTAGQFIAGFFPRVISNHWFLWSMLICFIIVWVMHFYLKDNVIIYMLGFIALFFIPDGYNLHAYKYLMPFYIVSFYVNQKGSLTKFKEIYKRNEVLLAASAVLFALLFLVYRKECFIYVSGYRITKNIWWKMILIDIYRMVIGFVGSIFWISLWKELLSVIKGYRFPLLTLMGQNSLGIYLISGYSTILIMRRFTDSLGYSLPRVILCTIIIAVTSTLLSWILGRIPYIKKIVGK